MTPTIIAAVPLAPIIGWGGVVGIVWLVTRRWRDAEGVAREETVEEERWISR